MSAGSDRPCAVRCRGLTKAYGEGAARIDALRGIDLDVFDAELFMLMGPSGCGKTTLISVISAILDPDQGRCEVLGKELGTLGRDERTQFRGHAMGFVFQMIHLLPALSVRENVAVPLLIAGEPRKSALRKAAQVLERIGLENRGDALPGRLSGGQQQKVAIGRALVHEPQLLICDEPTGSLDHASGQDMMALLKQVASERRCTLLVVTHDERILGFADRVAHMDDGRILDVQQAPKGEMTT